jgi:hypothetical protein
MAVALQVGAAAVGSGTVSRGDRSGQCPQATIGDVSDRGGVTVRGRLLVRMSVG